MTDKTKPPQPMAFKNLAELKRYIKLGTEFKATRHKYHPDIVGPTRVVTKVQTNGFYSKIKDEPNHRFSDCNGGKGFFTELGKAGGYIFDGTAVKVLDKRGENGVIYELEFYRENTEAGSAPIIHLTVGMQRTLAKCRTYAVLFTEPDDPNHFIFFETFQRVT